MGEYRFTKKEDYKGFEIFKHRKDAITEYYCIWLNGERYSQMCLNSEKACRNIIDTFLRSKQEPIYR